MQRGSTKFSKKALPFSNLHFRIALVEGAGAAGLAAALKEKSQLTGKRVGLVASGGNVDSDVFAKVQQD